MLPSTCFRPFIPPPTSPSRWRARSFILFIYLFCSIFVSVCSISRSGAAAATATGFTAQQGSFAQFLESPDAVSSAGQASSSGKGGGSFVNVFALPELKVRLALPTVSFVLVLMFVLGRVFCDVLWGVAFFFFVSLVLLLLVAVLVLVDNTRGGVFAVVLVFIDVCRWPMSCKLLLAVRGVAGN